MRSPNAKNVEEAVDHLHKARDEFLNARMDLTWLVSPQDGWENFRAHCQQLSQWIEHGYGVTEEMKPELVKTLFAAEEILKRYEKQYRR